MTRVSTTMMHGMKTFGTKSEVLRGIALKTRGGLTRKDITRSASGKAVSIKQQKRGFKLAKKYPPRLTQAPLFT